MSWRSWTVPVRLARRELWRRPGRTLLVALVVAVPVTAMVLLDINYRTTNGPDTEWISRQWGRADAEIDLNGGCADFCTRADIEAELPDGATVVWTTQTSLPLRTSADGPVADAIVTDTDMRLPIMQGRFDLRSGRWPAAADEIAVSPSVAETLHTGVGETLTLLHQHTDFTVVGIVDEGYWGAFVMAPGFDFSVVRELNLGSVGFIDLPHSFDTSHSYAAINVRPDLNGWFSAESPDTGRVLAVGWLGGVLAMCVFGVVVAAAFAISGRRQLVAIGQLSASGADARTLGRTLGLQGAGSGLLGVAIGLGAAAVVHGRWPNAIFGDPGRPWAVEWLDIVVIAITAVAVATIASLVPTRSLTRMSVLSALAGRRPVGVVPPRLVRTGWMLLVGGMVVTVVAVRSGSNGGGNESGMMVALGLIAAVLGVCALSPMMIDRLSTWAGRGGGSLRLAARSLGRHRPRAAAVLASLLLVGVATTGVAAIVERNAGTIEEVGPWRQDVVWVQSSSISTDSTPDRWWTTEPASLPDPEATRADAEAVLGPVDWLSADIAFDPATNDPQMAPLWLLVADEAVLDLYAVPAEGRTAIADNKAGVLLRDHEGYGYIDEGLPSVPVEGLDLLPMMAFISRENAVAVGLTIVREAVVFGVADHALSNAEGRAVGELGRSHNDALYYVDMPGPALSTAWTVSAASRGGHGISKGIARSILLASSLLLVMLVVAFGMALWAVEGRDERDVLVAVGASPSTMARVAAWRAGGLTLGAMVVAVPLGLASAWMIARAARGGIVMPWLLSGALLVVVPTVIGAGAWASSAIAQRVRPVRMSTLTAD